jgi:NTP pyrophosphatase (non-canonical NTP hydrolase)
VSGQFAFGDDEWPGIAKLAEECGEVIQVVGKLMMTHGDPTHWSGDLRKMLAEELADVTAAAGFVREHCLTMRERILVDERVRAKLHLFETWRREQRGSAK